VKIVCRKINDLRASTFLFSVICDSTLKSACTLPYLQALKSACRGMLDECKSPYPGMFNSNVPPALKSLRESLATLPATWPANHEWITPNRQPSPREPSSPRPATPPPSPLDAAIQAVQNRIDLMDQQEAHLQQLLQRQQELAEKQQRVATLQHKLQAVSQPVRSCQHCHHPLGFDHRVGHFRPPGMVAGSPKFLALQGLRYFYLGHRLMGWPTS